jgi:hypothetical protein
VLLSAGAAGVYALYWATALPFFPKGWPVGLALLAAALTVFRPRIGLAAALAVPVFPLGNISQGLAILYGVTAAAWFAWSWRRPREGLAFVAGPLLAPFGLIALLPLVLERCQGTVRRGVLAALGVLAAGAVAGISGRALPFTGDPRPGNLGIGAANGPGAATRGLRGTLAAEPALMRCAIVLAVAAAVLPLLRNRGPWAIALYGVAVLSFLLLPGSRIEALPTVAAVWATCIVMAARDERIPWRTLASRARLPVRAARASI